MFFLDNGFNLPADGGLLPLLFFFFLFFFSKPISPLPFNGWLCFSSPFSPGRNSDGISGAGRGALWVGAGAGVMRGRPCELPAGWKGPRGGEAPASSRQALAEPVGDVDRLFFCASASGACLGERNGKTTGLLESTARLVLEGRCLRSAPGAKRAAGRRAARPDPAPRGAHGSPGERGVFILVFRLAPGANLS